MPKTLIETSVHTAAVQVPKAGEDVTAASVEIPFQALTNRSKNAFDQLRFIGLQNWELGEAALANVTEPPVIIWVADDATNETPGWWVMCASHSVNLMSFSLSEDECGVFDRALAGSFPAAVTNCDWLAVSSYTAAAHGVLAGGAGHNHAAFQTGTLPGSPAFSDITLTGGGGSKCAVWNGFVGLFCIGGDTAGGAPAIWTMNVAESVISRTVPIAGISVDVVCMAVASTGKLVAFGDGDGAGSDSWTSDDGITWTPVVTTVPNPISVAYSESLGVWMVLSLDVGGTNGTVYTSSDDGATWSSVATAVPDLATGPSLVEVDDLWVTSCDGYVMASDDSGVTWRRFTHNAAVSVAAANAATGLELHLAYSPGRRRFASVHTTSGNSLTMNRSLTIGLAPEHS